MYKSLVFIGVTLSLHGYTGQLMAADTGDAPLVYGEASHTVVPGSPWLGNDPADDNAPVGDETAEADDQDGFDDEGGVFAFAQLVQNGKSYLTNVFATNLTANDATLVAWIDFDGSGSFDADEGVVITVPAGTENGKFRARWPDLTGISSDYFGVGYARYRISTDPLTVNDAQGAASDGEVEDYRLEILEDSDGDERPNSEDLDNDNDGILDEIEGTTEDTDGDGDLNYLDVDSDNDGIFDFIEAGQNPDVPADTDGDGTPDYLDLDSNNDDIPDSEPRPSDADQDGIMDDLEGEGDLDGDGIANVNDLDSDNDTIPDAIELGDNPEATVDTDGDGIPDFLDLDSDNDGITDIREANTGELNVNLIDTDNDGQVDNEQITGTNGLVDVAETAPDSGVPIFAVGSSDSDGVRDFRDLDSDADGVFDITETLGTDVDSNGIVDSTIDEDQDGIVDGTNTVLNNNGTMPDTNGNFVPDFQDAEANGSDPVTPTEPEPTDPEGEGGDGGENPEQTPEDGPASTDGQIQTGLSGGAGCSIYAAKPGVSAAGIDPSLPALLTLSGIALMLRRRGFAWLVKRS